MSNTLTLDHLSSAVREAAAFRATIRLQPAGGPGTKVFPPTYAGAVYAVEERRINGEKVPCVLIDSVQSQANRLEEALLAAYDEDRLDFPVLEVDFSEFSDIGRITTLDAPHRIADAIFRDSQLNGKNFRDSEEGKAFEAANIRNATALYQLCPTALVFGTWDSTGSRGGLGNKFARALVSEIIGVNYVSGVKTSSRIDPLGIEKCTLYRTNDGDWTSNIDQAAKDKKGNPELYASKSGKGNPSAINHGNVVPDIVKAERSSDAIAGGVTVDYCYQTAVLSMPALRRLRFPDDAGKQNSDRNESARTVLAALGLAAIVEQRQQGYFLRSRCDLVPESREFILELVTAGDDTEEFSLSVDAAAELLQQAVAKAEAIGLSWRTDVPTLQPKPALLDLVRKAREVAALDAEATT